LFRRSAYRNCIHIEIDLGRQPQVKYKTGDYLSVWPVSPASEVNLLLEMLGLEASRIVPFTLRSLDETPLKVPTPTTLEALFQSYLDICAPISREVIRQLIAFAPDRSAGDFLEKISADKKAHAEYVSHRYTTLGRLLKAACSGTGTWNQLPLSFVVEMLPAMQPRSYSISSSSVVQARQIAITAVVADTNLIQSGERIPGLTTNYLLHASTGSHSQGLVYNAPTQAGNIHASVRKSAFKLPTLASAPIIMVGAGTGVAPFRAFVQERSRLASIGREVGTTKLFFGCRNPGEDFLYADEFEQYSRSLGDSFSLTTAFSRPTDGSQKRYVQDAIMEEAQSVVELLLERNAHFYICGSAAMARDVSEAVAKVIIAKKGWSEDQMKAFADSQKRQKRWMQDVWG
jgi:NADPH-ferrihemoprotein reductase